MARTGVLADKNRPMSQSSEDVPTLYHSSWPYGLSSLLTDYIKKKNYNSKEMGKMPKPLLICPKPFQHVGDPIYGKIHRDVAC